VKEDVEGEHNLHCSASTRGRDASWNGRCPMDSLIDSRCGWLLAVVLSVSRACSQGRDLDFNGG
jgi:hypothetical protein